MTDYFFWLGAEADDLPAWIYDYHERRMVLVYTRH